MFCALARWSCFPVWRGGDWLTLSDGRREQCVILEVTESTIRVEQSSVMSVPVSKVVKIERESAADNAVLRAAYAYDGYKHNPEALLQAIRSYATARSEGASGTTLCSSLLIILQAIEASTEKPPQEVAVAMADLLSSLAGAASDGAPEEFFLRGSLFLAHAGRMDPALLLFSKISEASRARNPEWRQQLTDSVAVDIQALINEQKMEDALQRLLVLGRLDPSRNQAGQVWAHLAQADVFRQAHRYREAIDIYALQTAAAYPEVSKNRALATIREAIDDAATRGDFSGVMPLTLGNTVKLLGRSAAEAMRAQVYRQWGEWALAQKQYEQARECIKQYYVLAPQSDPSLLHLVEYRQRVDSLPEEDAEARYQLGVFCRENGLPDQAREVFAAIESDAAWGALAKKHLADLDNLKLEALLQHALELKDQTRYREAREEVARVMKETTDPELEQLATRTNDVILKAMQFEQKKQPLLAEVLWQQAERCILPDEDQTCLELVNRILQEYPDTPAARRAAEKKAMMLERGVKDSAGKTPLPQAPAATPATPASHPADDVVDPVQLRAELLQLQKSLETVAGP